MYLPKTNEFRNILSLKYYCGLHYQLQAMLEIDVTCHCTNKLFYCNLTHFLSLIKINRKLKLALKQNSYYFQQLGPPATDIHSCVDLDLWLQLTNSNDSYESRPSHKYSWWKRNPLYRMWTPSFVSIAMYPFLMVLGDQISQHIEAVMEEYRILARFN